MIAATLRCLAIGSITLTLFLFVAPIAADAFAGSSAFNGNIRRKHLSKWNPNTSLPHRQSLTSLQSSLPINGGASTQNQTETSLSEPSAEASFTPPVFDKSGKEQIFIERILEANFLFQDIINKDRNDDEDSEEEALIKKRRNLQRIIASFEKASYDKGSFLCQQGDPDADYLHIIYKGKCSVVIDGIGKLPTPYGTLKEKSMFGELSLLYDTPRAATVQATTPVTVFRLDRKSFHYFLYQHNNTSTENPTQQNLQHQVREIDDAIDKISGVSTKYKGNIIRPFQPQRQWLWRRWKGTILQHAWKISVMNMLLGVTFIYAIRHLVNADWAIGMVPSQQNPIIQRLAGLSKMWHYLMNITTFILTFFLSQAYNLWRDLYNAGRKIQGRLNDVSMLLATTAEREPSPQTKETKQQREQYDSAFFTPSTQYTPRAQAFLEDIAVYSRLYHALSWASLTRKFNILLTPRGLSRMFSRGIMTRQQYDVLVSIKPNLCPPHNACLMWMQARSLKAMQEGILPNDDSIRRTLIDKLLTLRGVQAGMGDSLDGRIPLAYAHFVQLLVDAFLVMAPFALYSELGVWSVPAVGLLTLFYSGLLDLSKILLDPLDNDSEFYANSSVNMDIGVLIRESNSGSNRWKIGLETLPF